MSDPTPRALWTAWRDAAARPAIDDAIRALYADLDRAVRDAPADGSHGPPTCNASGRCCKFDSYGHRLYVTGLEIAWFLGRVSGLGSGVSETRQAESAEGARFQLDVIDPTHIEPTETNATRGPAPATHLPDACRYQADGLCSTHTIRPLGCRVYFCTPGTEDWQHDVYERFQSRLQRLHTEHGLPYRYMEWRGGLVEADRWLA